jgi:hypothetical protein
MSKVEVGSFTVNSGTVSVSLDDYTMNVRGVSFQVTPSTTSSAEASTGFSDGVKNRSKSILVDSTKRESYRSTTYAIMHYRNVSGTSTRKLAGYVTGLPQGEINMTFDNYDATLTVDFIAYGD